MSNNFRNYAGRNIEYVTSLPFDLDAVIDDWEQLRKGMIRECPAAFAREEWAYLISFLEPANLHHPFEQAFGELIDDTRGRSFVIARPRGTVATWLPNNVSLLGPLTLIVLSLTGNALRFKAGSRSDDLTAAFFDFVCSRLKAGALKEHLQNNVSVERFDRHAPRNLEFASQSQVRIIFGSDHAAATINALPHPIESTSFAFVDRRSEAWIDRRRVDDETLSNLIRVFAVFGRAGCTSPRRLVLIDGSAGDCRTVRDRVVELWPKTIRREVPMHTASSNIAARQNAAVLGWNAVLTSRNAGVVSDGDFEWPIPEGNLTLTIVGAPLAKAIVALPENIQTIGHALHDDSAISLAEIISQTKIKRIVPLAEMHHFGPIWDGWSFWRQMFEEVPAAS